MQPANEPVNEPAGHDGPPPEVPPGIPAEAMAAMAAMAPGPELLAALDGIDTAQVPNGDIMDVAEAWYHVVNHATARFFDAINQAGLSTSSWLQPKGFLQRRDYLDEFSADELRPAFGWSRRMATLKLELAHDLCARLPRVQAALRAGLIDEPKARVFSHWTEDLSPAQTGIICDRLLPEAPVLTTGQVTDKIKRLAIALDPDWARRLYEKRVQRRYVEGKLCRDGTGQISGKGLPAADAAAACDRIDQLAKDAKRAGDPRTMDQLRADTFLALLDGTLVGCTDTQIITWMTSHPDDYAPGDCDHPDDSDGDGDQPEDDDGHDGGGGSGNGPTGHGDGRDDGDSGEADDGKDGNDQPGDDRDIRGRCAGAELRAELTTLLGMDEHPGEIPGYGPVLPHVVRSVTRRQARTQWTYAITGDDGQLLADGLLRARPKRWRHNASPARGGSVEIQVRLSDLRNLHTEASDGRHTAWEPVITELSRHATQRPPDPDDTGGPEPRFPGNELRRHVQARARSCLFSGCRHSAKKSNLDHRDQWQHAGRTIDANLDALCDHDHHAKDEGSWLIIARADGTKEWLSPLGRRYPARPQPIIELQPVAMARKHDPWDLAAEENLGDTHDPRNAEPSWGRETELRPPPPASPRYIEFHNPGEARTTPLSPRPPPSDTAMPDTPPF